MIPLRILELDIDLKTLETAELSVNNDWACVGRKECCFVISFEKFMMQLQSFPFHDLPSVFVFVIKEEKAMKILCWSNIKRDYHLCILC